MIARLIRNDAAGTSYAVDPFGKTLYWERLSVMAGNRLAEFGMLVGVGKSRKRSPGLQEDVLGASR